MLAFPDFSKRGKLRKCVIILKVVCYTSQLLNVQFHATALRVCVCVLLLNDYCKKLNSLKHLVRTTVAESHN